MRVLSFLLPFFLLGSASCAPVSVPRAVITQSKREGLDLDSSSFSGSRHPTAHQKKKENHGRAAGTTLSLRSGAISESQVKELLGASFFIAADIGLRKLFAEKGIGFPSQLGGCMILFAALIVINVLFSSSLADSIFVALTPGSAWLAKWMPVFFVPGLAMLPNAPSVGAPIEALKILAVVIVGYGFTLATTVSAVNAVSNVLGIAPKSVAAPAKTSKVSSAPAKAYTAETLKALLTGFAATSVLAVAACRSNHANRNTIEAVFMGFCTVSAYVFGARLPSEFTKVVHPLVTSTAITWLTVKLFALVTDQGFSSVLGSYKSGSFGLDKVGAGDVLLFMLGPAVVSFCIPMYSRKKLMKDNFPVVMTSMITASVGGLFGTAAFVRLLNVASDVVRLSVLARNVTTALSIAITQILNGDISIAASVVVLTGILGATIGARVLTSFGVHDPVARGLGVGASGQGLGVASIVNEVDAFPFGAVSMVLTAVAATCLVSIPPVKEALINLALGK